MIKARQFKVLNDIHSKLVIAQTFTNIKDQKGWDALKTATTDLYNFLRAEYQYEWDNRPIDPMI